MGDVRVPAAATLLAAVVAVLGSVFVVWLNARQQRRLQAAEFADRAETRRARWAEDRSRAARAAELDACVHLDAAIALALGQLTRMVDLAGRPGVRRKLMGRRWAQQWNEGVANATAELAVPLSTVRLTARPGVREERLKRCRWPTRLRLPRSGRCRHGFPSRCCLGLWAAARESAPLPRRPWCRRRVGSWPGSLRTGAKRAV